MNGFGLLTFRDADGDMHAVNVLEYARIMVCMAATPHVQLVDHDGRPTLVSLGEGEGDRVIAWLEECGTMFGSAGLN